MKLSGNVIAERTMTRAPDKQLVTSESDTEQVGPFTLDPVHATVGATVATTLSRNYHSAHISVSITIPVPATPNGLRDGFDYCFEKANKVMNKHLKGANEALDELATSRR